MDNTEEMDKFLYIYNLQRMSHKEIEYLNRPTMNKQIESVIKNQPSLKKANGHWWILPSTEWRININYIQTLPQKLKKQEHLQMYFMRL